MTPVQSIDAPVAVRRPSGVLWNTFTLGVIAAVGKLAGAGKSVAIARVFGSSPELDAYLLAFLIPSVLADTFCGALVPVTVPRLIELQHRSGRQAAESFYASLLARSLRYSLLGALLLGVIVGIYCELNGATPHLTREPSRRLIALLAALMLPVIPCNAVANVWRAALNSENRFAAPAITVVFTPIAISVAVLAAGHGGGAWILASSTTFGAVGELALLALAMRQCSYPVLPRVRPATSLRLPGFRKEYSYLAASGAVSGGAVALGQAMASWLGPGSVSTLNYGTRLSTVIMSIGPAALGVAVLPRFSHLAAELDFEELKRTLRRLLCTAGAATAAAAGVFVLLSAPIVQLALQHGAFTSADTQIVSRVQIWSLLQMPFVLGIAILMRVLSVLKANRVLLPLSTGALAVNAALNVVLMDRLGVGGIALASSISQALLFAAMAWLVFGPRGISLQRRFE